MTNLIDDRTGVINPQRRLHFQGRARPRPQSIAGSDQDAFQDFTRQSIFEQPDYATGKGDHFFEGDVELLGRCPDQKNAGGIELDAEHLIIG